MSEIFNKCYSLTLLPDISKWKVKNVYNFTDMFNKCISLSSLTNNNKICFNLDYNTYLFRELISLIGIPVINND